MSVGAFVDWCRILTVALLLAMFVALAVQSLRGKPRPALIEGRFSVQARTIVGLALMLGDIRALARPITIVPGDDGRVTLLIAAMFLLGALWMLLASLPLQRAIEKHANGHTD